MANCIEKVKYRCFDDCKPFWCPWHEMELDFLSSWNIYTFKKDWEEICCFEQWEMQAIIDSLKLLSKRRKDSINL